MIKERDEYSILKEAPFTAIDRMIVQHLREDWGESNYWILLAAAFCNLAVREGHTYFDLANPNTVGTPVPRSWPNLERWSELLAESRVVQHEGNKRRKPFVLGSSSCLYLEKYYDFEKRLANAINRRVKAAAANESPDNRAADASTIQRAIRSNFFVITGGPGTGKTTLALRYLNRLLDNWQGNRPARFAAIAPTGKAAARLAESIASGVQRLDFDQERKDILLAIPCLTIHRLLGTLPNRASFRKNARNPLRYDTLVVDESSMIDLPLMLRLFEALPEECQVLLLGDKDQLTSVDVGSVLNDILTAAAEKPGSTLSNCVERLRKTYRFSEDSGIYRACQLARNGEAEGFEKMLNEKLTDFAFNPLKADTKRLSGASLKHALHRHEKLANAKNSSAALALLNDSITLTQTRQGPYGSVEYNRQTELQLRRQLNISDKKPIHGTPIIVLENDYEQELFNGDIGIIRINTEDQSPYAAFQGADGLDRQFRLSELPQYESAFALTIHKSQGSEFEKVICIFDPEQERNLTRELVYTAFSRAKTSLAVYAHKEMLCHSISNQAKRATRLVSLLD